MRILSATALAAVIAVTLFLPAAANAAEADADADAESNTIVVTAQKRKQAAQDVPMSLYVLSALAIERQGVASLQELGNSVAGVSIAAANAGAMRLTIRGAGDLSSSNQSASVNGLYVDETVMSYVPGYMPEVSLLDIERVEVLRGPQGTLFGDGAAGGTLRIITRKPDSTRTFGRVQMGAYSTENGGQGWAAQGYVNLPLVQDVLAVTVAGGYRDLPGWIDVPDLNVKDSNTSRLVDGRIAVRFSPDSALTIDAFYQIGRSKVRDFISTEREELNPRKVAAALGAGPVGGLSPSEGNLDIAALTVSYDTGRATLVSASSLTNSTYDTNRDLTTALPAAFPPFLLPKATAQSIYRVRSRAFAQEVRLVSNGGGKLQWTLGGFFKHESRSVDDGFVFSIPAISTVDQPLSNSDQKGDAWAVFADLDYSLTEKLSVQAGLRHFEDDKTFSVKQLTGSAFPLGFPPAGTVQLGADSSDATSPKIGLTYKFSPEALVFAKYSQGFRSGGANTAPLVTYPYATAQFGPDAIYAYEIGLKTAPFAGWTVNIYLYHNDWRDLQLPFRTKDGVFTYVQNAGNAKTNGVEFEIAADVTPALNIGLTYAYNDASIDRDVFDTFGALIIAKGSQLPVNSKNKFTAAVHYERSVGSDFTLSLDSRYRWASKTFSDPGNTPAFVNQPTSQLYLGATLSGEWGRVTVFADNVFDRADTTAKYPPPGPPLYIYSSFLRPRNFGLEFKRTF